MLAKLFPSSRIFGVLGKSYWAQVLPEAGNYQVGGW
jgi:hypothetical protein